MGVDVQDDIAVGQRLGGSGLPPVTKDTRLPNVALSERPERSETGVWIGIFAIVMTFAALTSAMIVREGVALDWQRFQLPKILYLDTLILFFSSWTFETALAKMKEGENHFSESMAWLCITLALGGSFVIGQGIAWRVLAGQGLFLATNPSSSFFYVFTAAHALHLVGGILGLGYLIYKLKRTGSAARTTGIRATSLYWHFMDGLWFYLFVILLVRM
ncbi:MAG TPA: cytochrome c oxidase subunit 3 [Terriglobales bacterium]|nr:cytochrome c oxidase subunit 3 [Terriglobales bacterium]